MQFPVAVWWILIPILIGAIMPVIAQFYPTNQYFWSALVVAIGGAIVAAIKAWRDMQPTQPPPPPGVQADMSMAPTPQKSFMRRWLVG